MSFLPENFSDSRKVVAVEGTALAIGSAAKCKVVFVSALPGNTDLIVIGGSTVIYDLATRTGKILYAGDSITIEIDDISKIYINGKAGDGVAFSYTS
jgi:hypothetical protein